MPAGVPLLNHRIIAAPHAVERSERLQGSFRYRAATVDALQLRRPVNARLDELLAPLHRFAPRRIMACNFREGGFDNGAGENCTVHPVSR